MGGSERGNSWLSPRGELPTTEKGEIWCAGIGGGWGRCAHSDALSSDIYLLTHQNDSDRQVGVQGWSGENLTMEMWIRAAGMEFRHMAPDCLWYHGQFHSLTWQGSWCREAASPGRPGAQTVLQPAEGGELRSRTPAGRLCAYTSAFLAQLLCSRTSSGGLRQRPSSAAPAKTLGGGQWDPGRHSLYSHSGLSAFLFYFYWSLRCC